MRVRPVIPSKYYGYARSDEVYTEGTPGQAHFILSVRWGNLILGHKIVANTEGTPGQTNFTLRVRPVWQNLY